jgi:hypothetical protein
MATAPDGESFSHALASALHFTDVTSQSGIDMIITCGAMPSTEILEVNGGGLGLIDFDNDGDLDLFVANSAGMADPEHGPGCRLYENISPPPPQPAIRFRDITDQAQVNVHRWANGVAVGDYDGDGFDDLYICCYGPNILLHNNGDGTFAEAKAPIGEVSQMGTLKSAFGNVAHGDSPPGASQSPIQKIATAAGVPEWSSSAAFGDIDGDGDLDLYVCNYLAFDISSPPPPARFKDVQVMAGPHGLPAQFDVLYENLGDGTFRDITVQSGCRSGGAASAAYGLNVAILDFDNDGRQDIVVANDSMPDFFFHNRGPSAIGSSVSPTSVNPSVPGSRPPSANNRFEEIGVSSGISANSDGINQASMGIAIADVDGNGLPDKFTTVFSSDTNSLHLNLTPPAVSPAPHADTHQPLFEDRSQQYGLGMISRAYLGWSCGFFDFDHDADEDLFVVNGHVYPQATMQTMDSEYEQTPLLFERDGRRFKRVDASTAGEWLARKHRDRNAVFADLDGDGDIDIIIGELNGPIRVLRNDVIGAQPSAVGQQNGSERRMVNAERSWLIVELRDERANSKNRRGLGSKIELAIQTTAGAARQTRWLFTGGGFQSSGAPYAHFGLPAVGAHPAGSPPRQDSFPSMSLIVTWPDGVVQHVDPVRPGQRMTITRNE